MARREGGGHPPSPELIERCESHSLSTGEKMTTVQEEKIARRKLSLLQLAQELGNVSRACKIVGYSRQ